MALYKTITPLTWRVIVFVCLFVAISGLNGPRIISSGIVFSDGFALYGGIGRAAIFGLIAFWLLMRRQRTSLALRPWRSMLLVWMLAAMAAFVVAWAAVGSLIAGDRTFQNLAAAHVGLWLSVIFAAIGCFGLKNLGILWRAYRRQIIATLGFAVVFYFFLLAVYALWHPLASVVLYSVSWLLGVTGVHATVLPPDSLILDKFGITVAQYCSGIESIALFTGLYAVVGLLDWHRLNKWRYFAVFPFALAVLFGLNILRVYGLVLAGYYINPRIAFSLFHTYAGMVFFIIYSGIFWLVSYKYLLQKDAAPLKEVPK